MRGLFVKIRKERPSDYDAIYRLIKKAFETAEHSDGTEQKLAAALRKGSAYIPELALVAEEEGALAGHIMLTRASVGDCTVLALAPLSVLPEYQGQGIGSALVREAHRIAADMGYPYSVVLGSEAYYPRFGYRPACELGIRPPFDVPLKNFMAFRLRDDAPALRGTMKYAGEFGL